jgi:hypothetical protein
VEKSQRKCPYQQVWGDNDSLYLATDKTPLSLYELASYMAKEHGLPLPIKQTLERNANQNQRLNSQRLQDLGYVFR